MTMVFPVLLFIAVVGVVEGKSCRLDDQSLQLMNRNRPSRGSFEQLNFTDETYNPHINGVNLRVLPMVLPLWAEDPAIEDDYQDVQVAMLCVVWALVLWFSPWKAFVAKWKAFWAIRAWKAFSHGKKFYEFDYTQPKFVPKLDKILEENPEDKLLSRLDMVLERLRVVEEEQRTLSNSFSAKLQLDEQLKMEQTERLSAMEEVLQGIVAPRPTSSNESCGTLEPLQNMLNAMAVRDLQRQIEKQINDLTQWEYAQTQRLTMDLKRELEQRLDASSKTQADLRQDWDAFAAQVQRQGDEFRRESELKIENLLKRRSPGKKELPKTRGKIQEYQVEVIRYPVLQKGH